MRRSLVAFIAVPLLALPILPAQAGGPDMVSGRVTLPWHGITEEYVVSARDATPGAGEDASGTLTRRAYGADGALLSEQKVPVVCASVENGTAGVVAREDRANYVVYHLFQVRDGGRGELDHLSYTPVNSAPFSEEEMRDRCSFFQAFRLVSEGNLRLHDGAPSVQP